MICILCQRRKAEYPQACEPCRLWLPTVLRDVAEGCGQLDVAPVDNSPDQRAADTVILSSPDKDGRRHPLPLHDPVRQALPSNGRSPAGAGRVSGSHGTPAPVQLDPLDLTAPARLPNPVRGPGYYPRSLWPEDQIGHQSVATRLDLWVRDWISYEGCPGDHLPDTTVPGLVAWLTVRVQWACDHHPAIDEFAAEMRELRAILRRVNLGRPELPEVCDGVICSGCDLRNTLYRHPGSQWRAECGSCGKLYTDDEYQRWTGLLANWTKGAA